MQGVPGSRQSEYRQDEPGAEGEPGLRAGRSEPGRGPGAAQGSCPTTGGRASLATCAMGLPLPLVAARKLHANTGSRFGAVLRNCRQDCRHGERRHEGAQHRLKPGNAVCTQLSSSRSAFLVNPRARWEGRLPRRRGMLRASTVQN
jgi:hypothetical protein